MKIRAGLVHRRTTAIARLDSLLEILGPGWIDALGTRMTQTTFKFLAAYANPAGPGGSAWLGWLAGSNTTAAKHGDRS